MTTFAIVRPEDEDTKEPTPMEKATQNLEALITALMTEATLRDDEQFKGEHEVFRTVLCALYSPAEA